MKTSVFAALFVLAAGSLAHAADWVNLDNGFSYQNDSIQSDGKAGGSVVFRTQGTGTSIFVTSCDGNGATSPVQYSGAARKMFLTQTHQPAKQGTILGFLYNLVCK